MSEWYEDHSNLVDMARRMADANAEAKHIVAFIEQPWRWTQTWEDRNDHNDDRCNGILECERKECDVCHDRYPECQIRVVNHEYKRDEWEEFDACPTCREEKPWTQRGWGKADF